MRRSADAGLAITNALVAATCLPAAAKTGEASIGGRVSFVHVVFFMSHMINSRFVAIFRRTIDDAAERLLRLTDADVSVQPAPGKWSRKEIIGHLIDSAANNHCRFVRAQLQDDLVFPGYDQDDWVRVQRYRERAWPDLVQLWHSYNHHIAGIMETADVDALRRPRPRHNLHQLAWRPVPESVATTLEDFMNDYVEHLKHHLRQASVL